VDCGCGNRSEPESIRAALGVADVLVQDCEVGADVRRPDARTVLGCNGIYGILLVLDDALDAGDGLHIKDPQKMRLRRRPVWPET
jgi:hypothetical protein